MREQLMRRLGAALVVELAEPLAHAVRGRRRQVERGERGAQVEPAAAAQDRRAPAAEHLVDRHLGHLRVLRHRALVVEPPDADQVMRHRLELAAVGWLVRIGSPR